MKKARLNWVLFNWVAKLVNTRTSQSITSSRLSYTSLYYIITIIYLSRICILFATYRLSLSLWSKRDWGTYNKAFFFLPNLLLFSLFFIPFPSTLPLLFSFCFFLFSSCFFLSCNFLREFIFLASCFSDGYSNKFSVIVRWLRIWGTPPYGKKVTGDFSRKYSETNGFRTVCYLS